jgi:hypothetical protein
MAPVIAPATAAMLSPQRSGRPRGEQGRPDQHSDAEWGKRFRHRPTAVESSCSTPHRRHVNWFLQVRHGVRSSLIAKYVERLWRGLRHAFDRSRAVPPRSKAFNQVLTRLRAWSERNPDWAVPVSPTIRSGVPHDLSPRRPRRWPGRRRRPRRGSSITRRATVAVVPVTAVIPVLVRAPAVVPLLARAPVMVVHGCRRRCCLGDARGHAEGG